MSSYAQRVLSQQRFTFVSWPVHYGLFESIVKSMELESVLQDT